MTIFKKAFFYFCFVVLHAQTFDPDLGRFLETSDPWLGTPYAFDPVGDLIEGAWRQPGAPDRPSTPRDALDCVSFVDDTLARMYGDTSERVEVIRTHLRYASAPYDWFHRNHFTDLDWLKAAQSYLTPYVSSQMETAVLDYDLSTWWRMQYERAKSTTQLTPEQKTSFENKMKEERRETMRLKYWPWSSIMDDHGFLKRFNPLKDYGWAVVLFVRHGWPKDDVKLLISHMGFIWDNKGTVTLRHAGRSHGVEDVPLFSYLSDKKEHPSWIGMVVLRPKPKESTTRPAGMVGHL